MQQGHCENGANGNRSAGLRHTGRGKPAGEAMFGKKRD
jgi:hypothetical protein